MATASIRTFPRITSRGILPTMMNLAVKKLEFQDIDQFVELIGVFEKVFEMKDFRMPDRNYLQPLLKNSDFWVFVALLDNKVVGGLTSYTLQQYYSHQPLVYLYDLAVETEHQRKGIGRMLMASITRYATAMGMEEVFVQADLADQHALEFYHATGGIAEKVVHFCYPSKGK